VVCFNEAQQLCKHYCVDIPYFFCHSIWKVANKFNIQFSNKLIYLWVNRFCPHYPGKAQFSGSSAFSMKVGEMHGFFIWMQGFDDMKA
jgi:hypothetical protein